MRSMGTYSFLDTIRLEGSKPGGASCEPSSSLGLCHSYHLRPACSLKVASVWAEIEVTHWLVSSINSGVTFNEGRLAPEWMRS